RRVNDRAQLVIEDRVVLVLPGLRVTHTATLPEAMELLAPEIPAPRALQHVSADGRDIAKVRRRGIPGSVGQSGVLRATDFMPTERTERHHRPDMKTGPILADLIETWDRADVDQLFRRVEPLFEAAHDVDPAGFHHRLCVERGNRVFDCAGVLPLEFGDHAVAPCRKVPSAASTRAGVIGSSRTRTPVAL